MSRGELRPARPGGEPGIAFSGQRHMPAVEPCHGMGDGERMRWWASMEAEIDGKVRKPQQNGKFWESAGQRAPRREAPAAWCGRDRGQVSARSPRGDGEKKAPPGGGRGKVVRGPVRCRPGREAKPAPRLCDGDVPVLDGCAGNVVVAQWHDLDSDVVGGADGEVVHAQRDGLRARCACND